MRHIISVLLLFFPLLLAAQPILPDSRGAIRGQVLDARSDEPLAFLLVFLQNTTYGTQTDQDGRFSLTKIPPGKYALIVRDPPGEGLGPDTSMIEVKAGQIVERSIRLRKPAPPPVLIKVNLTPVAGLPCMHNGNGSVTIPQAEKFNVTSFHRIGRKWKNLVRGSSFSKYEPNCYDLFDRTGRCRSLYERFGDSLVKVCGEGPEKFFIVRENANRFKVKGCDVSCENGRAIVTYRKEKKKRGRKFALSIG